MASFCSQVVGSLGEEQLASSMHQINIWKENQSLTKEKETKLWYCICNYIVIIWIHIKIHTYI